MTDVWLYLDSLLAGKMLVKEGESKQAQAATEAQRCKRLMGALRYLFRNRNLDLLEKRFNNSWFTNVATSRYSFVKFPCGSFCGCLRAVGCDVRC